MKCKKTCITCEYCCYVSGSNDNGNYEYYACKNNEREIPRKVEHLWNRCDSYKENPDLHSMDSKMNLLTIEKVEGNKVYVQSCGISGHYDYFPAEMEIDEIMSFNHQFHERVSAIEIIGYSTLILNRKGYWKNVGASPVVWENPDGSTSPVDRGKMGWKGIIYTDNKIH